MESFRAILREEKGFCQMAMRGERKIWNSTKRMGIITHSLTKNKKVGKPWKSWMSTEMKGYLPGSKRIGGVVSRPGHRILGYFWDICVTYTLVSQEGHSQCWQSSGWIQVPGISAPPVGLPTKRSCQGLPSRVTNPCWEHPRAFQALFGSCRTVVGVLCISWLLQVFCIPQ